MDCDWLDLLCMDGLGDVEDGGGGDCTHAVHSVASKQKSSSMHIQNMD
jgi:hypothetical protein